MDNEKIIEIWERGDREEILKMRITLREGDYEYRVIGRRKEALPIYFKNHTEEEGFFFHPKQYTFLDDMDGEERTFILEGFRSNKQEGKKDG